MPGRGAKKKNESPAGVTTEGMAFLSVVGKEARTQRDRKDSVQQDHVGDAIPPEKR